MNLPTEAQKTLAAFTQPLSWEQRARLLMQWGAALPELDSTEKTPQNLVQGCESQVWLVGFLKEGCWQFRANSEARLIRGLVAVLLARVNGLSAEEVGEVDLPGWFEELGLSRQLSPSRSNGLNAVLGRMRELTGS